MRAIYKPGEKQCWFCIHNGVNDVCCDCAHHGDKRAWKYGTFDDRHSSTGWTQTDQDRYLAHLASVEKHKK